MLDPRETRATEPGVLDRLQPPMRPSSEHHSAETGAQAGWSGAQLRNGSDSDFEHRFEQIAKIADSQYGLVTSSDIAALAGNDSEAGRLARRGYLVRRHRGVYAVGTGRLTLEGRLFAAVLACGSGTVVSHTSAASLWNLREPLGGPIHVTRRPGGPSRVAGIKIHQSICLDKSEVTIHRGVPVTTVARTLFDLASQLDLEQLEDAAATAARKRLTTIEELSRVADQNRFRPGAGMFRAFLEGFDRDVRATRSRWERRILRLCRDAGVRSPEAGVAINGYEVDLCWREEKVIVEFDSRAFHTDFKAFDRDRERDASHNWNGYRIYRVTYRMLRTQPDRILAQVKRLLAERKRP